MCVRERDRECWAKTGEGESVKSERGESKT